MPNISRRTALTGTAGFAVTAAVAGVPLVVQDEEPGLDEEANAKKRAALLKEIRTLVPRGDPGRRARHGSPAATRATGPAERRGFSYICLASFIRRWHVEPASTRPLAPPGYVLGGVFFCACSGLSSAQAFDVAPLREVGAPTALSRNELATENEEGTPDSK